MWPLLLLAGAVAQPIEFPFRRQPNAPVGFVRPAPGCSSDVILVIDRSGSEMDFLRRQVLAAQFPLHLSLSTGNHRLGVVAFSDEADQRIESLIARATNPTNVLTTILDLKHRPSKPFLESALSLAKTLLLDRRRELPAHVVLLSDADGVTKDATRLGGAVTIEPAVSLHVVSLGAPKTELGSLTERDLVLGGPPEQALNILLSRIGRCFEASLKRNRNVYLQYDVLFKYAHTRLTQIYN